MLLLAHRGASADMPENTLDAFEEAMRQGADGVELDARLCGSGEVVVCHDDDLRRVAGLDLRVDGTGWQKLREIDVGRRLKGVPARIPLLAEVLRAMPPKACINVELKCEGWNDGGLTAAVVKVIREARAEGQVVISSFNAPCLARLRYLAPKLRRGYLIDPDRSFLLHGRLLAGPLSNYSVHPSAETCTAEGVRRWRAHGLEVAVWTVDEPQRARAFRDMGVRYLITNQPKAVRAGLS